MPPKRYTEMKPPESCLFSSTPRGHLTMMGHVDALTIPIPDCEYTVLISNGRQNIFLPLSLTTQDISREHANKLRQDVEAGNRPDVLAFDVTKRGLASEMFNNLCAIYDPLGKHLILTSRRAPTKGLN